MNKKGFIEKRKKRMIKMSSALDQFTDEQLIQLTKNKTISPKQIPTNRWTIDFARQFIEHCPLHKIPKDVLSETEQLSLYQESSYVFRYFESPCYVLCEEEVKRLPSALSQVPKKHRTKELCDLAIELACQNKEKKPSQKWAYHWKINLGSIPKGFRTPELCLKAIQLDGKNLRFVPELTDDLILKAIETTPASLKHVPKERMTQELILKAIERSGRALEFVPEEFMTPELLEKAIQKSPCSIRWVKNPEESLCLLAVRKDDHALSFIEHPTPTVILAAMERNPFIILDFPTLQTNKMLRECGKLGFDKEPGTFERQRLDLGHGSNALHEDFDLLASFNDYNFSDKLSELDSVEQLILLQNFLGNTYRNASNYQSTIQSVLSKQKWSFATTEELIKALTEDRSQVFLSEMSYQKVKEQLSFLRENGLMLRHIAPHNQKKTTVQAAINQTGLALKYVAPRFKSSRLCRLAVANCPEAKLFSPYHIGI